MNCDEMVRQLKEQLNEANEKYNSTNDRIAEIHRLQADIEQANVKVLPPIVFNILQGSVATLLGVVETSRQRSFLEFKPCIALPYLRGGQAVAPAQR